ncbi:MAG: phage holin family protein [Saprospiraceae bacterium]|nr:phage holin family protein [Saprospiraceae bacterium]
MNTIIEILIYALSFIIGAYLLKGVTIKNFLQAIIVALVVGVLDYTLGNVLRFVTLGLLSWGIFTWLLNAILIQIADYFLSGLKVKNFWWALGLAAIVSIVSGFLMEFVL